MLHYDIVVGYTLGYVKELMAKDMKGGGKPSSLWVDRCFMLDCHEDRIFLFMAGILADEREGLALRSFALSSLKRMKKIGRESKWNAYFDMHEAQWDILKITNDFQDGREDEFIALSLILSPIRAQELFLALVNRGVRLPLHHINIPYPMLSYLALFRSLSPRLYSRYHRPHRERLGGIENMKDEQEKNIKILGDIDNNTNWEKWIEDADMFGRSFVHKCKEGYVILKAEEIGKREYDVAIIHDSQNRGEYVFKKFSEAHYVQFSLNESDVLRRRINGLWPDFTLSDKGQFMVVKDEDYYHYLRACDVKERAGGGEKGFEDMRALVSLNLQGVYELLKSHVWTQGFTGLAHDKDQPALFAPYLYVFSRFTGFKGALFDRKKAFSWSNFSKGGYRDPGNLLKEKPDQNKGLNQGNQERLELLMTDRERRRLEEVEYTERLHEIVNIPTQFYLNYLVADPDFLDKVSVEAFLGAVLEDIYKPLLSIFCSDDIDGKIKFLKMQLEPLYKEDFVFLKKNPDLLDHVLMDRQSRHFPLQNIYLGESFFVAFLTVCHKKPLSSFKGWRRKRVGGAGS